MAGERRQPEARLPSRPSRCLARGGRRCLAAEIRAIQHDIRLLLTDVTANLPAEPRPPGRLGQIDNAVVEIVIPDLSPCERAGSGRFGQGMQRDVEGGADTSSFHNLGLARAGFAFRCRRRGRMRVAETEPGRGSVRGAGPCRGLVVVSG